jgi:hypothetical protein
MSPRPSATALHPPTHTHLTRRRGVRSNHDDGGCCNRRPLLHPTTNERTTAPHSLPASTHAPLRVHLLVSPRIVMDDPSSVDAAVAVGSSHHPLSFSPTPPPSSSHPPLFLHTSSTMMTTGHAIPATVHTGPTPAVMAATPIAFTTSGGGGGGGSNGSQLPPLLSPMPLQSPFNYSVNFNPAFSPFNNYLTMSSPTANLHSATGYGGPYSSSVQLGGYGPPMNSIGQSHQAMSSLNSGNSGMLSGGGGGMGSNSSALNLNDERRPWTKVSSAQTPMRMPTPHTTWLHTLLACLRIATDMRWS